MKYGNSIPFPPADHEKHKASCKGEGLWAETLVNGQQWELAAETLPHKLITRKEVLRIHIHIYIYVYINKYKYICCNDLFVVVFVAL